MEIDHVRGTVVAVGLLAAAAAALAGATAASTGNFSAAARDGRVAVEPTTSSGRVYLSPAEIQAGVATGFLPENGRSVLRVDSQLKYGDFIWNEDGVPQGKIVVSVDLRTQIISVFRAGHEIGTAVIVYGADGHATPLGRHPVLSKVRDYRSKAYDAPMPYTLWLTGDGVAIHASDVRQGRATHGCIGVPGDFAAHLFRTVQEGDVVNVVQTRPPRASATDI